MSEAREAGNMDEYHQGAAAAAGLREHAASVRVALARARSEAAMKKSQATEAARASEAHVVPATEEAKSMQCQ
eukprot:scaffold74212_cov50-Prasinocladus_malaysianus.AAC.1